MEPFIALEMCGGVPVFSVVFQLLLIWRVFREGILYSPMLAEEKIQGWFADAPHCSHSFGQLLCYWSLGWERQCVLERPPQSDWKCATLKVWIRGRKGSVPAGAEVVSSGVIWGRSLCSNSVVLPEKQTSSAGASVLFWHICSNIGVLGMFVVCFQMFWKICMRLYFFFSLLNPKITFLALKSECFQFTLFIIFRMSSVSFVLWTSFPVWSFFLQGCRV